MTLPFVKTSSVVIGIIFVTVTFSLPSVKVKSNNAVVTLILVVALITEVRKRISKESKYERYIKKLLRDYDSYITEATSGSYEKGKPVIKVESFKELLDVRNNVEKTIVYVKVDNDTSKFVIIDNEVYEYVVKRGEMDK